MAAKKKKSTESRQQIARSTIQFAMVGIGAGFMATYLEATWSAFTGMTFLLFVIMVAPVIEETLKALPILYGIKRLWGLTDTFENRMVYAVVAGGFFGVTEFTFKYFAGVDTWVLYPVVHIIYMLPLAVFYDKDNKWLRLVGLLLAFTAHAATNAAILGVG